MDPRKKLGEILVEQGILTSKSVERMLGVARRLNKRIGIVLEEMELVTDEELAAALAQQYGAKVVKGLAKYSYPPELLGLITSDVALQNILFPIKVENKILALAIADPTDIKVVKNIAACNGLTIVPYIATRKDIHAAICKHYLGKEYVEPTQRTVLVVDDDPSIISLLSRMLTKQDYNIISALDGMEAFKEAIAKKPHVIITDKVIPKLDGYALLNALKNLPETTSIPVILITGQKSDREEATAFQKGFFDFISKPFNEIQITSRVKRALLFYDRKYQLM